METKGYLSSNVICILVACKLDKMKEAEYAVSFKCAQELSEEKGFFACVETSSKTGEGVTEVFEIIASELLRRKEITQAPLPLIPKVNTL